MVNATHLWIRGGLRADRQRRIAELALPQPLLEPVDAHRRLRGPYTAAGTIVRAMVPEVLARDPRLARGHDIELLSAAPELSDILPNSRETLTSMALPKERTRYYARMRTMRIAHGLLEFIRDGLPDGSRWSIVLENVDQAEPTDQQFLAAALRRIDPARLTLVVAMASADSADPGLLAALERYAHAVDVAAADPDTAASSDIAADAWRYVASECTSDIASLRDAYHALPAAERAQLHDRRAAQLQEVGDFSLLLGAINYHLEHGSDPAGAGLRALYDAQDHCVCHGFYHSVIDFGYRALALFEPSTDEETWWALTVKLGLALSITGRTKEALRIYDAARLQSIEPTVHMKAAYSTAMLYTRHNEPEERDERMAKTWLNGAIATASLIEDPSERAFQSAFYKNGLALVEVNLGDPQEALRLVDSCIESLDRLLTPEEHKLHRSVLKNNRARVYSMLGRIKDALDDYAIVIEQDPNHCEHYLERANLLRRLGRHSEALVDYRKAIALTPPFPEIYYNRGDLRLSIGDVEGALEDLDYVLELDPDFVDAYVNRAGIHLQAGRLAAAEDDATAGLLRQPGNPHLLTVLAQVHAENGRTAEARDCFDRALAADPDLVSALSGRATLAYEKGEFEVAMRDLSRAVSLQPGDHELLYNRAFLYQQADRWDEALADLTAASELSPDDPDIIASRELCLRHVAAVS